VHRGEGDEVAVFELPEAGFNVGLGAVGGHDLGEGPLVAVGEQDPFAEVLVLQLAQRGLVGAPGQAQFGCAVAGEGDGKDPVQPAGCGDGGDLGVYLLAGAAGAVTAMIYVWRRYGKPDPSMLANGMLAGLVAITAPCAFVTAPSAVLIGGVAGVLVCVAVVFIEQKLKIDDPVGASSVHGVCGAWGVLSLGLLADGTYVDGTNGIAGGVRGLFYGDPGQFGAEVIGVLANIVFVGLAAYAAWRITALFTDGHRVSPAVEEHGLDLPEMGALAYPDQADLSSAVVISNEVRPAA